MASYVVLARKWRPAQFSDLVGQSHIVRTLMNAIRSERIHQAYLLTGSRGIGKTSIARIFAKAVRCESAQWMPDPKDAKGTGWLKSCDECSSCKEIAAGSSVDVIEIDGASNNGVDAIREIRENVKYLPSAGKRKIYIVDEVHMLTTAAFNALLKTLEEPPAHVIFIFATTEPHKIPATILSRCQRFDLRRVTMAQIQSRLVEVTSSEGVQCETGALALVARAAEGSIRDALSLLDQVIAFSGNKITVQSVRESIGLIESQVLIGVLSGILSRKSTEALGLVEQAYQQGHDLRVLTRSLIEFLHGVILAKVGAPNSPTLELSEEEWKELQSLAALRPLEELEMIFQVLHQGVDWIARSPQPKIVLDVLVVKCATAEALVFIDQAASGGSGNEGPQKTQRAQAAPGNTSAPIRSASEHAAAPVASAAVAPVSTAGSATPLSPAAAIAQSISQNQNSRNEPRPATSPQSAQASARPAEASTQAAPARPAGPVSWEGFIAYVRQSRPLLASILEHGSCSGMPAAQSTGTEDDGVSILFKPEDAYFREQLTSRVYSEQLSNFGKEYFGRVIRFRVELRESGQDDVESLAEKKERQHRERETAARLAVQNHPVIREAKTLFGGELGPIELIDTEPGANAHASL